MRLFEVIAILLHLSNVYPKKKYKVRSSESIENILYYKDCNHKKQPEPTLLRSPPQPPECKMCCTMCCGDQCVNNNQLMMGSQAQGVNIEPKMQPMLPNIPSRERRKKINPIDQMNEPKRRGLSFTRENIKSLISKDDDIRKILKDLVRVTMQKVDLMELINSRRNLQTNTEPSDSANSENDL